MGFVLQTQSDSSMQLCPGIDGTEINRGSGLGRYLPQLSENDLASGYVSTGQIQGLTPQGRVEFGGWEQWACVRVW